MTAHPLARHLDERVATVGRAGTGKTVSARGGVEAALAAHHRTCVIDPLDVWWGLRLQPDGKTPAFPVVIFGGAHADIPITEHSGAIVGKAIAQTDRDCIVSLGSLIGDAARRRFCTAFLAALYDHNKESLLLVVDEADILAPQRPMPGFETLLGHMQDIVRRGRVRGFIPWLITQRPAVLNKDVLSQADVLVAMNLTANQDRDAIGAWIEGQADRADAKRILAELPRMKRGEGYIWAPTSDRLEKVAFPMIGTLDTSRTPKRGEKVAATELQPLDLGALREKIAAVEIEAKANDAPTLRKRIAELEREGAKKPTAAPAVDLDAMQKEAWADGYLTGYGEAVQEITTPLFSVGRNLIAVGEKVDAHITAVGEKWKAKIETAKTRPPVALTAAALPAPARKSPPPAARKSFTPGDTTLPKAERLILTVLAQRHPERVPVERIAAIAGYAVNGGGFRNSMSSLRTKALIADGPTPHVISGEGLAALGDYDPLPTGRDLLRYWQGRVAKAESLILGALDDHRGELDVATIASATGYAADGGGFRNALSRLRTLGLITGRGTISLHEDLR